MEKIQGSGLAMALGGFVVVLILGVMFVVLTIYYFIRGGGPKDIWRK